MLYTWYIYVYVLYVICYIIYIYYYMYLHVLMCFPSFYRRWSSPPPLASTMTRWFCSGWQKNTERVGRVCPTMAVPQRVSALKWQFRKPSRPTELVDLMYASMKPSVRSLWVKHLITFPTPLITWDPRWTSLCHEVGGRCILLGTGYNDMGMVLTGLVG